MSKAIAIPTTGDHGIVDSQGICIEESDIARGFVTKRSQLRLPNEDCEQCNDPGLPGLAGPRVVPHMEHIMENLPPTPGQPEPPPPPPPPLPPLPPSINPRGIYVYGTDEVGLPSNNGARLQIKWSEVEKTKGTYTWTKTDALIAKAKAAGKQCSLTLYMLSDYPAWFSSEGGVTIYTTANGPIIIPWDPIGGDPIVDPLMRLFIAAVCQRYDGQVNYIVMGGLGFRTETYMPLPSELTPTPAVSDAAWAALWEAECNALIDVYGANLTKTPFIVAGGDPFTGNTVNGPASFTRVFNYGLHQPLFGLMQWGLSAHSTTGFFVNGLIAQYSVLGRICGFQATGTATIAFGQPGHVGGDIGGTLAQMLDAGIGLGARFIEIYPADALDAASQSVIDDANRRMLAIS